MSFTATVTADSASMGPRYAERLVKDVPAERFARLAKLGGETIQSNHPAFILGHLCLYPHKVLTLLGKDASGVEPPAGWEELFSKAATCVDDPEGTIYPPAQQIAEFFQTSYAAALEALREASEEQLTAANPIDTPMKAVCPTLGALLAFYLNGHVMMHLGQLSAWRRMEKLPPA